MDGFIKTTDKKPAYYTDVLVIVQDKDRVFYDVGEYFQARKEWSLNTGYYSSDEVIFWKYIPDLSNLQRRLVK